MKNKIFLFILLGLFLITNVSAALSGNLTGGLVAWWSFEEETGTFVRDSVNLNNGTNLANNVIINQTGKVGKSYLWNGASDRINISDNALFYSSTGYSVGFWYKTNASAPSGHVIGQWGDGGVGNAAWEVAQNYPSNAGQIYLTNYDGSGSGSLYSSTSTVNILNNSQWHLLVFVYTGGTSGTNGFIYIDNVLNSSGTINKVPQNSAYNITIGDTLAGGGDALYPLYLDEVFFYNKSLNASQINEIWNGGDGITLAEAEESGNMNGSSSEDNSSSSYPKYYDFVKHWTEWMTNATLSSYIFSWNISSSWVNDTPVLFSGSTNWSNITKNITAIKGTNIGWYIWANDSEGKVNTTSVFEYLVRNSLPTSSIGMFNETGVIYNGTPIKVNVSIGDLDGLSDISSVIATVQKNKTHGSGEINLSKISYIKNGSNPVFSPPSGFIYYVEASSVYENGFLHQWWGSHNATGHFVFYSNTSNGNVWSDNVVTETPARFFRSNVMKVNNTYYMFAVDSDEDYTDQKLYVVNSSDKIHWNWACSSSPIINPSYSIQNPSVYYNNTDGSWHIVLQGGTFAPWYLYYWNSSSLCSGWTDNGKIIGEVGAADPDLEYINDKFILYYANRPGGATDTNISVAYGDTIPELTVFGNILNHSGGWETNFLSDPDIAVITDNNPNFSNKFYLYFNADQNFSGEAYDSLNRTFEEAHFDLSNSYIQNITLSQVGSTSEWSGTFTNTSYIGLYNLTKIYVNDTDNAWNTSSYSAVSFETQEEEEGIDTSSCSVYFNTTSPMTYPNKFIAYTNCTSDYTLYINGTSISNGTSIDGAGYYNISVVRTNQDDYAYTYDEQFFTINTFDDGCSIFFNETSPVYYPNTFTVWTNCSTGTLRRNNTEITNNSEQDLTYGVYNFSFQRTDTQNYTTNYIDEYFEISDNTPPTINVTMPPTNDYRFWINYTNGIYRYFPYTSYFINWTSYDDNLDTCWFENISSLNFMIRVNETVTCNANATIVYPVSTGNTLRFYANDTYGNIFGLARTNITNEIRIDRSSHSYLNTSIQGDIRNFWIFVRKGFGDVLENVTFVFNNTDYPIADISTLNYSTNITIPNITGTTTYYWKFDFGEGFFNSTIYNITVGAIPVITINSPTNSTYYLTSASPNVTINFSVADDNFVNATYNVNGTNMTSLSNETQVNLNLSTGTYNLYVWTIDGNGLIDYETLVFSVKNLNQLTPTYTSSIYETQTASYVVNLTDLYNTNLSAVTLFINGSSYTPTQSGYIWNYTRQSPANYLNNISLIWQLTYSGVNYNTTTYYQLINPINFGLCNATYTVPYLNLSFKDETPNIPINGTIQSSTFVYYLGNGTANKTVYYSTSSNYTDYRFCFLPGNLTYYIYPSVSYNLGTDYPLRTWNPVTTSYTNSTTNQTLYLLGTSVGSYVTFQVVNSADQPLSGVNVNATRLIDGISTVVAQGTTDSAGSIQFWLNPDYLHTFMFSKSGYPTFTTSLFPTEAEYTITLGGSSSSSGGTTTDYTRGIKLFVYPKSKELQNDTTYNFIFNMTSSYWDVDEYGFSLRLSNGTIIGTDTEVTEESGTSISYNVNNQSIIYMDYYYDIDGNYINNTVRWVVTNSLNTDWSIKTLVEDANTYMDSGLFGLDNFGRYIISFLLLFLVVGIVGYKYGVVSPFFMSVLTFAVVFFLDVITGILPTVRGVEHLLTYVAGLIALLVVVWDLTR